MGDSNDGDEGDVRGEDKDRNSNKNNKVMMMRTRAMGGGGGIIDPAKYNRGGGCGQPRDHGAIARRPRHDDALVASSICFREERLYMGINKKSKTKVKNETTKLDCGSDLDWLAGYRSKSFTK